MDFRHRQFIMRKVNAPFGLDLILINHANPWKTNQTDTTHFTPVRGHVVGVEVSGMVILPDNPERTFVMNRQRFRLLGEVSEHA